MLRLSAPPGVPLEQAPQLDVHVAGAESNVAIALCRLGTTAGWISRLVDTPLGRRIVNELRAHGVDVSRVLWAPDGRVGVYFLEQGIPPRQHRIIYDRAQSAMALLNPDDIDWEFVRSARLVHLTGITPALSAGCRTAASRAIAEARRAKALVCFDVNYRAKLWSADEAKTVLGPLLADVDILLTTADDARLLLSGGETAEQLAALLAGLGLTLPRLSKPVGTYVDAVRTGNLLFLAGKGPRNLDGSVPTGKVGRDVSTEEGYQHARQVGLMLLAAIKEAVGSLDRVRRVVKVLGMVNAIPEFTEQPKVINGCSDLFVQVFGERGQHARSAVGMGSLPGGITVEIEAIVEVE